MSGTRDDTAGGVPTGADSGVLVLLCESLSTLGSGLDLAGIVEWLRETAPSVQVEAVDDLCRHPRALRDRTPAGMNGAVLGLCSGDYSDSEIQHNARKAGLDPLAVEKVNLGGYCALPHGKDEGTAKAKVMLAAAVARASAFPGGRPESVRPYLIREHQRVSRRALFTLPPIAYRPVATIDRAVCRAGTGCQQCVQACPVDALARTDERIVIDRNACAACGICVTTCPVEAADLAGSSLPQIEAEMTALLAGHPGDIEGQRAIVFVCQKSAVTLESLAREGVSYPAGWLPVSVPCAGMVSAGMLLQAVARGAAAASVLGCGGDCRFGQRERVEARVDYCSQLLSLLGRSPDLARFLDGSRPPAELAEILNRPFGEPGRGVESSEPVEVSGPEAAAKALLAIAAEAEGDSPPTLAHPESPLGLVDVDATGCTGCGSCSQTCPTGALELAEEGGAVALTYDAGLCNGCSQCVEWCPEHVVRVDKATDLRRLSEGRVALYEDREVMCESCGAAVGPAAMLRRIEALLAADEGQSREATIETVTRLCARCRVVGVRPKGRDSPGA